MTDYVIGPLGEYEHLRVELESLLEAEAYPEIFGKHIHFLTRTLHTRAVSEKSKEILKRHYIFHSHAYEACACISDDGKDLITTDHVSDIVVTICKALVNKQSLWTTDTIDGKTNWIYRDEWVLRGNNTRNFAFNCVEEMVIEYFQSYYMSTLCERMKNSERNRLIGLFANGN